jgi:transcriptional regulator with XRE-family HTH domain
VPNRLCYGASAGSGDDGKGKGTCVSDERHFGKRLREARLSAGLSQSDLEDISGIPKARLSRYENGHVEPSIQTLNRLARALNVSEASLLGDERAALEEFETVLREHGIALKSKEQARQLAESFARTIRGGSLTSV